MKKWWILGGLKFLVFAVLAIGFFGWVVMELWNWLLPALFDLPYITFWQALGLLVLSKILFGWPFSKGGGHGGWRKSHWKKKFQQKWENMTPEEREQMKDRFKKCSRGRDWWPEEEKAAA